jgi:hypothetical protein
VNWPRQPKKVTPGLVDDIQILAGEGFHREPFIGRSIKNSDCIETGCSA